MRGGGGPSQLAGIDTIPALVREVGDDAAIAMALIENIQRKDLNPVEEAVALKRLQHEFELSQQQVAERGWQIKARHCQRHATFVTGTRRSNND